MIFSSTSLPPLRLALVALAVLFAAGVPQAQPSFCAGDVVLDSQVDVDVFDCTHIEGRLFIGLSYEDWTSDITDLSPLAGLTTVGSDLLILGNHALGSLAGLDDLTAVGGYLAVASNHALGSLSGLENLAAVGGLAVLLNDGLVSLDGLQGLTAVFALPSGDLSLPTSLEDLSLTDLDVVTALGGNVVIALNSGLASLSGLDNLAAVSGFLAIADNDALGSLSDLESLSAAGGLFVVDNHALENLVGLQNVFATGYLSVVNNASLAQCSCGLSGVIDQELPRAFTGVLGSSLIAFNAPDGQCNTVPQVLADTCTLPLSGDLTATATTSTTVPPGGSVSFDYTITNTARTLAEGDLWFTAMPTGQSGIVRSGRVRAMTTVAASFTQHVPGAIEPGDYTYTLKVGRFPDLVIDTTSFTITVEGPPIRVPMEYEAVWTVSDATPWEVVRSASGADTELAVLDVAYPNPFARSTTIGFSLLQEAQVRVTVYDMLGRTVAVLADGQLEAGRHTATFDAGNLASGVYLVHLAAGNVTETRRVTVAR